MREIEQIPVAQELRKLRALLRRALDQMGDDWGTDAYGGTERRCCGADVGVGDIEDERQTVAPSVPHEEHCWVPDVIAEIGPPCQQ